MSNTLTSFAKSMCYYSCLLCTINRLECSACRVPFMCEQRRHGEEGVGEQRGLLLEPWFPQNEREELGLCLVCPADRALHYVRPTGLPLLHCEGLHRPHGPRLPDFWLSRTLYSLQQISALFFFSFPQMYLTRN